MRILLDTNAYSEYVSGNQKVTEQIRNAERVYVSTIVVGELLAGSRHGSRGAQNRDYLEEFMADPAVEELPVTRTSAEHFGSIWSELRAKGRPIPSNDIWIAAQARETGAELVSFDAHFEAVSGLSLRRP